MKTPLTRPLPPHIRRVWPLCRKWPTRPWWPGGKDAASPLATGARLEPGRPAARAGPTRATCVGRPSWRPTCCPWPLGRPKCRRPRRPAAVRRPPGCRPSVCLAVSKAGGHGCRPPGCRPPGCRPPGCRPPGCRCIWPPFCKEGGPDIKRGPAGHDAGRLIKRRPRAGRRWRPTGLYPSSPH